MLWIMKNTTVDQAFVTLRSLSEELNMDRSHLRKYVLRIGIAPFKVRTAESGHQETLAVSIEQAEDIRGKMSWRKEFGA